MLIKTRGSEYSTNQFFYAQANSNTDIDSGSLFGMFWDTSYDSSTLSGYTIGYMDFVYIVDGSDTFTTYTYQDSGIPDKSINIYGSYYSKTLYTWGNTGDGDYSVITIGEGGVNYYPIEPYPIDKPLDRWIFGDKYIQMLWTDNNYTGATLYLYSEGVLQDSIFFDRPNDWNYGYNHNVFFINNEVDSYYVNNSVSAFTPIDYYDYTYGGYMYWNDTGHNDGRILFLNTQNGNTAFLLEDSFVTGTTLPINGGDFNIRIGKDKFMYVYNLPTWEGNIVINLYDFNFNLLNSYQTEFDNWNNIYSLKDRFIVQFYNNTTNENVTYLISETAIENIVTGDYNWTQINDFYWD